MRGFIENPAFKYFRYCAAAHLRGLVPRGDDRRGAREYKSPATPEDEKLRRQPVPGRRRPRVARLIRAHRNALRECPLALVAGLLYVLAGASPSPTLRLMATVAAGRWLGSVFYLKAVQPRRTATFAVGALATGAMLIHTVVLVAQAAALPDTLRPACDGPSWFSCSSSRRSPQARSTCGRRPSPASDCSTAPPEARSALGRADRQLRPGRPLPRHGPERGAAHHVVLRAARRRAARHQR